MFNLPLTSIEDAWNISTYNIDHNAEHVNTLDGNEKNSVGSMYISISDPNLINHLSDKQTADISKTTESLLNQYYISPSTTTETDLESEPANFKNSTNDLNNDLITLLMFFVLLFLFVDRLLFVCRNA